MSVYLCQSTETYRADTEAEAKMLIDNAKKTSDLIKYTNTHKDRKAKGEIIDEWQQVVLTKAWNDPKEPAAIVNVDYDVKGGGWQAPEEDE